jgi:hypothetical protein
MKKYGGHAGELHDLAVEWLMDRANPEEQGGLGVFADTRFCSELETLLKRVDRTARADERKKLRSKKA